MKYLLPEHKQVLFTLRYFGLISPHAMQSIFGQIKDMNKNMDVENYLRRIIKNCGKRKR